MVINKKLDSELKFFKSENDKLVKKLKRLESDVQKTSTKSYQDEIVILNNKINEIHKEKMVMEKNVLAVEDRLKTELEINSNLAIVKKNLELTLLEIEKKLENEKSEKYAKMGECRRLMADLKLIENQFCQKKNDYAALVKYHQKEVDNLMNELEEERIVSFKVKKYNKDLEQRLNQAECETKPVRTSFSGEVSNLKVILFIFKSES